MSSLPPYEHPLIHMTMLYPVGYSGYIYAWG